MAGAQAKHMTTRAEEVQACYKGYLAGQNQKKSALDNPYSDADHRCDFWSRGFAQGRQDFQKKTVSTSATVRGEK